MPNIEYRGHITLPVTKPNGEASKPLVRISGFSDTSHILFGSRYGKWQTSCGLMLTFTLHGTNPVYSVEAGVATCRKCTD